MNKRELAEAISTQVSLSKKAAKEAVDSMCNIISQTLGEGEDVRLKGFGTFAPRPRKSSVRRNPITGARVNVPAKAVVSFKVSTDLKALVRKKLKVVESSSGELSLVKAVR